MLFLKGFHAYDPVDNLFGPPMSRARRPVIGIIGNHYVIGDRYPVHTGGTMNSDAVFGICA